MPDGDYKFSSWTGTNGVLKINENNNPDAPKTVAPKDDTSLSQNSSVMPYKYTDTQMNKELYDIEDYDSLASPVGEHPYGYEMDFLGSPHSPRTKWLINSLNTIRKNSFEPHWKYLRPGVDFGKAVQKELKKFQEWCYATPADGTLNWSTEQKLVEYLQDPYRCMTPGERYLADNANQLLTISEELLDILITPEVKQEISNISSIAVEEDVIGILSGISASKDAAVVYDKGVKNNLVRKLTLEEKEARKIQQLLQRQIETHESEIIRLMREMNEYLDKASEWDFDLNKKYTLQEVFDEIEEWGKYVDNEASVKGLKNEVLDLQIKKHNAKSIGEKSIKEINQLRSSSAPVSRGGRVLSAVGTGGKALGWGGAVLSVADVAVCAWAYRDVPTEENENNLIASIVSGAVSLGTSVAAGAVGGAVGGPFGVVIGVLGGALYGIADLVISGVRDDGKSLSLLIVEGTKRSTEYGGNDLPCWEVPGPSAGL